MEINQKKETVFSVTGRIVSELCYTLDTSSGRASLAKLRNSIGKPFSETVELWPMVFEKLPESYLSSTGKITAQEKSILTSLQLYALHQQGNRESVSLNEATDKWENIGASLRNLRNEDSTAIDRRFNTMITATSYEELTHHLRQLVMVMKSKKMVKVNYARLAEDLFWFSIGNQENVRIRWAQSYYRANTKKEKGEIDNAK